MVRRDPMSLDIMRGSGMKCPRCGKGPMIFDASTGEYFCGNCGFVVKEKVEETGPEWRAFSKEEKKDRSRAGIPSSLAMHDMGLATVIGEANKDAAGRSLSPSIRTTVERLRTWDSRSQVHEPDDRNLRQAFSVLDRLADKLHVGEVVTEKAAYIYRKALEKGLVRGRSISALVSAALYAACREMRIPRTLDEISKYTRAGRKDVARCYRLLVREASIKIPLPSAVDFAPRIGNVLKLSGSTIRMAIDILKRAQEQGLTAGKDPAGLAAAAIYIAAMKNGEMRTQKEVARAAQVTEVTIRNRYKELTHRLDFDISL